VHNRHTVLATNIEAEARKKRRKRAGDPRRRVRVLVLALAHAVAHAHTHALAHHGLAGARHAAALLERGLIAAAGNRAVADADVLRRDKVDGLGVGNRGRGCAGDYGVSAEE